MESLLGLVLDLVIIIIGTWRIDTGYDGRLNWYNNIIYLCLVHTSSIDLIVSILIALKRSINPFNWVVKH